MSNFGGGEMLAVLLLALIVLGPERLPKVARQAGAVMRQLRQMSSGFQEELRSAFDDPQPGAKGAGSPSTPAAELPLPAEDIDLARPDEPSGASTAEVRDRRLSAVPDQPAATESTDDARADTHPPVEVDAVDPDPSVDVQSPATEGDHPSAGGARATG